MLDVRDISVAYGAHEALHGVSVRVEPGELVVILGANGAGKSSLLNVIAGTSEGSVDGTVHLDGQLLTDKPADEIVELGIAFVPEGRGIFGDLTVAENLALGAYSMRARVRQDANLTRVLKLFPKLAERQQQIARTMSGGEQQMVAVGRALMADPKILMLDEPSLGLAPVLCKELFQNLATIRDTGVAVLMVEQNARQSLAIADRGYLLENGAVVGADTAAALLNDTNVQRAYLGGAATTGLEPAGATGHPRDSDVTASPGEQIEDLVFVQPARLSTATPRANLVANTDIDALVARADEQARSERVHAVRPDVSVADAPVPSGARADAALSRDPDVERVLAEMEAAATAAATGSSGAREPPSAHTRRVAPETFEDLPEIPIYRRARVEIYRRGPGGALIKQEKS